MHYLTDRKRATGLGSAKTGTEHHWQMQVSAVALAVLMPLFVLSFGFIVGAPYEEVVAYYARPVPALIAGLTLVVGLTHFKNGAIMMIEDYAQGFARKALVIGVICLSYALIATGLYALIRLAL
jgi:succinate dehydrogenase / fumarate reductase membrane anchor subunit